MLSRKAEPEYAEVRDAVLAALIELNSELKEKKDEKVIRSFHIEYDYDVEGWVANLVWCLLQMPEIKIDKSADLSEPDLHLELCKLSYGKLANIVAITYCDYRTEEEYQSYYGADLWQAKLIELTDAE